VTQFIQLMKYLVLPVAVAIGVICFTTGSATADDRGGDLPQHSHVAAAPVPPGSDAGASIGAQLGDRLDLWALLNIGGIDTNVRVNVGL
jgi:hypothetical protein